MAYDLDMFKADVGGVTGLWLGVSVWNVIQIVTKLAEGVKRRLKNLYMPDNS